RRRGVRPRQRRRAGAAGCAGCGTAGISRWAVCGGDELMAKHPARGNVPQGTVQRKFYLSEALADALRIEAAKRNVSQSAIVERALKKELAQELAQHGRHMAQKINEYRVIYSDHQGTPHEAIQLPWSVVRSIL